MNVQATERRRAGRSEADPTMSPAAARESFPASPAQLREILALVKEREVPEKAMQRIWLLHFSEEGIPMATAEKMLDYLSALPLKDGVDIPFV